MPYQVVLIGDPEGERLRQAKSYFHLMECPEPTVLSRNSSVAQALLKTALGRRVDTTKAEMILVVQRDHSFTVAFEDPGQNELYQAAFLTTRARII